MQRSGSQKVLLIVSILEIVSAVFALILGIMAIIGVGAAGTITTGDADADTIVMAIFDGSFGQNWVSNIISLVWPALMFWIANNIKQEAGK